MRFEAASAARDRSTAGLRDAVRLEPWFEGGDRVGRIVTLWRDGAVDAFGGAVEPRRALWLNERCPGGFRIRRDDVRPGITDVAGRDEFLDQHRRFRSFSAARQPGRTLY